MMSTLHVITSVFNPSNYKSRYRLYEDFKSRLSSRRVSLRTIELAFEGQDFAVTEGSNPRHIQLRTSQRMWFKENLINIAISRLPPNWRYVVWLDADIAFVEDDWVERTLDQLQEFSLVQPFSHVIDLGPQYEPISLQKGFASCQQGREPLEASAGGGQPGYAWAAKREAIEGFGGLIDWSILGANDYYMALALVGKLDALHTHMPESNYARTLLEWQDKVRRLNLKIGYVDTPLLHYWHGSRKDRGYGTRWEILKEYDFDPSLDLARTPSGLLQFTNRKPLLHQAVAAYFDQRREDSLENG